MDNPIPFLIVGAIFIALSIGLHTRAVWMWYAGWVFFYMIAAYRGWYFFTALFKSPDGSGMAYATCWLIGTMMIWVPAVVWWSRARDKFGPQAKRPAKSRPRAVDAPES